MPQKPGLGQRELQTVTCELTCDSTPSCVKSPFHLLTPRPAKATRAPEEAERRPGCPVSPPRGTACDGSDVPGRGAAACGEQGCPSRCPSRPAFRILPAARAPPPGKRGAAALPYMGTAGSARVTALARGVPAGRGASRHVPGAPARGAPATKQ